MKTDSKEQNKKNDLNEHTLTPEDFERLIAEKMERAKFYSFSYKERERRAQLVD